MDQGHEAFDLSDLLLKVLEGVSLGKHAEPLPGRFVMEKPVAKVADGRHQVARVGEHVARLGAWPSTRENSPQAAGPNQTVAHELMVEHELPSREFGLSDNPMVVGCDVTCDVIPIALFRNELSGCFGKVVSNRVHGLRRRNPSNERSVSKARARPPEIPQVRSQRAVNGIAKRDFGRTYDRIDGAANVRVPEVDPHQFDVVGGLEDVLVTGDSLVGDKLINQGRAVLKRCWHFVL